MRLLDYGIAGSLDSQQVIYLKDIVGKGPCVVHSLYLEDLGEVGAEGVDDPLTSLLGHHDLRYALDSLDVRFKYRVLELVEVL